MAQTAAIVEVAVDVTASAPTVSLSSSMPITSHDGAWWSRDAASLLRGITFVLSSTALVLRRAVVFAIDLYRRILSPILTATLGPACRFEPSCAVYGREAIARYGIVAGGRMMLARLARCRPAGGWGHDPVPQDRSVCPRSLIREVRN